MAKDYVQLIQGETSADLFAMYERLATGGRINGWPSGIAFEHIILRSFEIAQAEVTYPFEVRIEDTLIEQIDGVVRTNQIHMLVESKDYNKRVNVEPIAKVRNQLTRRPPGVLASVFSIAGFTVSARVLAGYSSPLNVLLWERDDIRIMLRDAVSDPRSPVRALHTKYKWAVETGDPSYSIQVGY